MKSTALEDLNPQNPWQLGLIQWAARHHHIAHANRSTMEEVVRRAEAGKLNPSIGHIVLLEQVSEAHRLMDTSTHTGKIVLSVD